MKLAMRRIGVWAAAVILMAIAAGRVAADRVIDQQNPVDITAGTSTFSIPAGDAIGQTFTPTLAAIDFATLNLQWCRLTEWDLRC